MDDLAGYVSDDELACAPLRALGWSVETVSWRDANAQWERYAAVIIRSTWDYQKDLPAFLEVLSRIERKTRLANSIEIARWNADKVYLREMEGRGAKIVPTLWGESGISETRLKGWLEELHTEEIVVKPTVSAGAENTFRLSRGGSRIGEAVAGLANRSFMVQPFMRSVVEEGEYSLFYFNGAYSHAILKTPKPNDFRVQEEHGGDIQPCIATTDLLCASEAVLRLLNEVPLYARTDFARDERGEFCLMELELIEPSLYLRTNAEAPHRFARAIDTFLT